MPNWCVVYDVLCKNAAGLPEKGIGLLLTRQGGACYNLNNKSNRPPPVGLEIRCISWGVRHAEVFTHIFLKGFRVGEWMPGLLQTEEGSKRIAGLRPAERRVKRRRRTALWDAGFPRQLRLSREYSFWPPGRYVNRRHRLFILYGECCVLCEICRENLSSPRADPFDRKRPEGALSCEICRLFSGRLRPRMQMRIRGRILFSLE